MGWLDCQKSFIVSRDSGALRNGSLKYSGALKYSRNAGAAHVGGGTASVPAITLPARSANRRPTLPTTLLWRSGRLVAACASVTLAARTAICGLLVGLVGLV